MNFYHQKFFTAISLERCVGRGRIFPIDMSWLCMTVYEPALKDMLLMA